MLDVAYVGSFGRHLSENTQLNTVPFGAQFLPQNQNPQTNTPLNDSYFRPYPGYGNIPQQIFEGNSSYHSLQVTANRRFAGIAGYDRPDVLTFHFPWDVPKVSKLLPNPFVRAVADGWQISDITSFIPGRPLSIAMSTSPAVNFIGGGDATVPLIVGNPILPRSQRTFDRYYNVAAFAEPIPIDRATCTVNGCPPMTFLNFGNSPRMPIRGPGTNNWNLSVFKNFTVHEWIITRNSTAWIQPSSSTRWARTRALPRTDQLLPRPRIMQFALRLSF